jgi:DNA-binding XRE family transcriptional regulator
MSGTYGYDRESFLNEFFPDPADRQEVEAGAERLVATNRAYRLAEMRRRLGLTQADVADRMHVRQERVSAIERAKIDAGELRTLAAYVKALGGRLEIVADFGGERLVIG